MNLNYSDYLNLRCNRFLNPPNITMPEVIISGDNNAINNVDRSIDAGSANDVISGKVGVEKSGEDTNWWRVTCDCIRRYGSTAASSSSSYNYHSLLHHPGNILLISSIPLCAGAYIGYKIPTDRVEELVESRRRRRKKGIKQRANPVREAAVKVIAARTASKALRIATVGTVGAFSFLGAIGFYVSGYDTFEDAVSGTKTRASIWYTFLERFSGGDQAISKTHPEVVATKDMNEDEELQYLYHTYIKENYLNSYSSTTQEPEREYKKPKVPTLYEIYLKYFSSKD